jgi:tetratricopeptide (TPR) repeat protein
MMKRLTFLALIALAAAGCTAIGRSIDRHAHGANPYQKEMYYSRYLDPANPLDQAIRRDLEALKANPRAASVHNDLGGLLFTKGFRSDAQLEFERAVYADKRFYAAWYNLGLTRAAGGDFSGAEHAFQQTVHYKPGHAAARFQLGLLEEKRGNDTAAVEQYARAFTINRSLLDARVNPTIVESRLIDRVLLKLYPNDQVRATIRFQPAPPGYTDRQPEAPPPQAPAGQVAPPATPATAAPASQPAPAKPAPPPPKP